MVTFLNKKISFTFFLKQKWYLFIFVLNIIINLLIWIFLIWQIKPTNEPIPLSYNIYFGIDYLGDWQNIFLGPLIGLIIIFLNYFLAYLIFLKNKFLSYWLIFTSLIIQIFILTFYILLIINFY